MSSNPWVSLVKNGQWRIAASNGEYLDVEINEGEAPRLTTATEANLKHLFTIREFEDAGNRRYHVWAEPVSLQRFPGAVIAPQSAGSYVFPFTLVHDGCSGFQLEALPTTHPLMVAGHHCCIESSRILSELGVKDGLAVGLDAFTFLNTFSGIGFPVFTGDESRAFQSIAGQTGVDPHSPLLTLAALSLTRKPDDIPQAAWDVVVNQLKQEIDYRELARNYFSSVDAFVQNVFISNSGLVENVGTLISLDRNDTIQLLMNQALKSIASAVGGLSFTGAGIVSGALGVLVEQLIKDRGPSAGDFSVALAGARQKMSDLFDSLVTAVQNWRADVFTDWGKLKTMGDGLKSGAIAWPANDEPMRLEAKRQLEISLFKDLLKVRWNNMTPSNEPRFTSSIDYIPGYIERNKNYWIDYRAGTQTDLFGKVKNGYYVTSHWLGRGSTIFNHKQPDDRMCIRLFNELKVSREIVFRQWGLQPQTFIVQQ